MPHLGSARGARKTRGAENDRPDEIVVRSQPVPVRRTVEAELRGIARPAARARIAGLLRDLKVSEGDQVAQGDEIARVVDPELASRISAAQARARAAGAARREAETDLRRQRELFEVGTVAAARFEDARRRAEDRRSAARAAQEEVQTLEARRARGRVLAPADGAVLEIPPTEGVALRPGDLVARVAAHPLRLRIAIPEGHLDALREDARIRLAGDAARPVELARVLPDLADGRVEAEIVLPEAALSGDRGPIGRSVPVELTIGRVERIVVPSTYVDEEGGLAFVHRVEAGRTLVRLGRRLDDGVVILSGLRDGDRLAAP